MEKKGMKKLQKEEEFRCGFVAIVGRPNVGKSTLINGIMGRKISIVTPKPQTTRNRILAVKNLESAQIIFIDTPGIHKSKIELNRRMVKIAMNAISEADVVVVIVEATTPVEEEAKVIEEIEKITKPPILLINKIDLIKNKNELLPIIKAYNDRFHIAEIIPISALLYDGIDRVLNEIIVRLPPSPPMFPEDMITDMAERFFVAEIIREKIILKTKEEVPYSVAVDIEIWEESETLFKIGAIIYVEKESQKGIIIGKGGERLKEIGILARQDIEKLLGCKVYLELWVKVQPHWRRDPVALRRLGYE